MGRAIWDGYEMPDEHRSDIEKDAMDVAIDQDPDGQAISAPRLVLRACGIVEKCAAGAGRVPDFLPGECEKGRVLYRAMCQLRGDIGAGSEHDIDVIRASACINLRCTE
jgi:hypothetical protein